MVSKKLWNNGCGGCGWPALWGRSGWKEEINVGYLQCPDLLIASCSIRGVIEVAVMLLARRWRWWHLTSHRWCYLHPQRKLERQHILQRHALGTKNETHLWQVLVLLHLWVEHLLCVCLDMAAILQLRWVQCLCKPKSPH